MKTLLNFNSDFKCTHCRNHISTSLMLAGVNNRNHCPYCLWSRHMDLFEAGDRLSACKSPMQPIGLTTKRNRKKYSTSKHGELMLIHQCVGCTSISINRIAADDIPEVIIEIYDASAYLTAQARGLVQENGIVLLDESSSEVVFRQLYGQKNSLGVLV